MKYWKIKNVSKDNVKFTCKTSSSTSRGVLLKTKQFCIVEPQMTAHIEAQERRGFIEIDKNFDNTKLNLEIASSYSEEQLVITSDKKTTKSKLELAAENVEKYKNQSKTNQ